MEPNIPFDMTKTINHLLSEDYASKESSQDFINCLETCGFYPINKCEIMTELPIVGAGVKDKPLNWINDVISPTDNLLSFKESQLNNLSTEEFISWNVEVENSPYKVHVFFKEDESNFLVTPSGEYFHHFINNSTAIPKPGQNIELPYDIYNTKYPPLKVRSKLTKAEYCIKDMMLIVSKQATQHITSHKIVKKLKPKAFIENITLVDCIRKDDIRYEAYTDKSIKISFPDRTVLRYTLDDDYMTILTNLGDYKRILLGNIDEIEPQYVFYTKEGLKYANSAFLDEKEKVKQKLYTNML